jgi:hypothetical protein
MAAGLPARPDALAQTVALHLHEPRTVSRAEILSVMRRCTGYDPTATTNGARFQAEVLLELAREERMRNPEGPPLLLGYAEWFEAFLEFTGRTASTAPQFARLAYQHQQDMEIDYRMACVIRAVREGPPPELAVNVKIWWPATPKGPKAYSYKDTLSTPNLKVTNHRVITYRLLAFKDWMFFDEIEGLTGRPTSGLLGFLFRLIGEGRIVESRMAIAGDGLQISRARAKKAFMGVSTTVTVFPNGYTQKDVLPDRPDLATIETRLKQPLEIDYEPIKEMNPPPRR